MPKIQTQYSRDKTHTCPVVELKGGGSTCPNSFSSFCDFFFFTQNKMGGGGAPSLDLPLHTYLIATPYKDFQLLDYKTIILKITNKITKLTKVINL